MPDVNKQVVTGEAELTGESQARQSQEQAAFAQSASQGRNAEQNEADRYEAYTTSVNQFGETMKELKKSVKEADENAKKYNAENVANDTMEKTDGPISFAEALEMVEGEKAANKAASQAKREALSKGVGALGKVFGKGVKVIGAEAGDTWSAIKDTVTSPEGLATLGVGGALGLLIGDTGISGTVLQGFEAIKNGWDNLEENNPTEVDPKYVDGYDPDSVDQSAFEDAHGDAGDDPYPDGQGEMADENQIIDDDYTAPAGSEDALNTSEEDMDVLASYNNEEPDEAWLDQAAKALSDDGPDAGKGVEDLLDVTGSLMDKVAESTGVPGVIVDLAEKVVESDAVRRMRELAEQTDRNAEQQAENSGPDYASV